MGRTNLGRRLHSQGYVILSGGRHGRYEHRVIAEQKLGRPLLENEHIHHINGVKTDNRPENIAIVTLFTHMHNHRRRVFTQCGYCSRDLEVCPSKIKLSKSGLVFCNNHCSGKYNNGLGIGVKRNPFTNHEKRLIQELRARGLNYCQIGKRLNRPRESIRRIAINQEVSNVCS